MEIFNGSTEIIDRYLSITTVYIFDRRLPDGGRDAVWPGLVSHELGIGFPTFFKFAHKRTRSFYGVSCHSKMEETISKQMGRDISGQFMYTFAWINKGTSHYPSVMSWLRDIFCFSALSNCRITARYISTTDNVNSDTISRLIRTSVKRSSTSLRRGKL